MQGKEQKWKIGDGQDQQKKTGSHRGCRSRLRRHRHRSRECVFPRSQPQYWRARGPRHKFLALAQIGRARPSSLFGWVSASNIAGFQNWLVDASIRLRSIVNPYVVIALTVLGLVLS